MKRPYDAETIQKGLEQRTQRSGAILPPKGICGAVIGSLDKACGGKPERDKLLFHLFDVTTSKELTVSQWVALSEWVGVFKNEEGPPAWGYSEFLDAECLNVLDSIRYNGMSEREKMAEMKSRVLAKATKYRSSMTQLPGDFDKWEEEPISQEDSIEEIGY